MKFFNEKLKKIDVAKKFGDLSQIGGIKQYILDNGISKGISAIDLNNGNGFIITILSDRGMDISDAKFKGIPIAWKSSTQETHPWLFDKDNKEILRTFFGGLLTTCGITYAGGPCEDDGEKLGLHGRISNLPAKINCISENWEEDECKLTVSGKVRESSIFGYKLELSRNILMYMGQNKIYLHDSIENIGSKRSPVMVLYHINLGYPVLSNKSKLIEAKAIVEPRDEEAEKGKEKFGSFSDPIKDFNEKVYIHDIEQDSEGFSKIALINEHFNDGIGVYIKFKKDNLPLLNEWKMMGEGEYVVGLSPANCTPRGRDFEKSSGTLKYINPGEKLDFIIEIGLLDSNKRINEFIETL